MKVKKYVAPTMKEALEKMKKDLGESAVILGSRKISRGGMLDFLGREMVELTATNEENVAVPVAAKSAGRRSRNAARVSYTVGDTGAVADPPAPEFRDLLKGAGAVETPAPVLPLGGGAAAAPASPARPLGGSGGWDGSPMRLLQRQLDDIKNTMGEMAEQIRYQRMPALPAALKEIYRRLVDSELEESIAVSLIQRLYGQFSEKQYSDREFVEKFLIDELTALIKIAAPTPVRQSGPLVLAFVGPTGVGKTTSLAKLATNKRFYGGCRTALVTTDTYRVAATQQLGTFSEIADIPMEIVHSPRDLSRAIEKHKDKEVILVDTAGASQYNDRLIEDLRAFLEAADPDEVHLTVSITTKPRDLKGTIKRFRMKQRERLLFTKFDETLTFGSIISVVQSSALPLSYVTFGQEVPEDIEPADAGKIARLVVNNIV
ncbi:flagellar biosynthesis protein FlhF [bacterium]|nr:flagellar biosynthesis protein FlhF [bacterium]